MKKILIVYGLFLFGCKPSAPQNEAEIPDALQKQSSFSLKKRSEDLVDKLYSDLASKTPELNRLELDIEKLKQDKSDSLEAFQKYNGKSDDYYFSAERHLINIEDSVFRKKIEMQIRESIAAYDQRKALHQQLIKDINSKSVSLDDLHEALKILKTLPVIASYQRSNLPPTAPLSVIQKRYAAIVQQTDTLVRK